jgi:integrase
LIVFLPTKATLVMTLFRPGPRKWKLWIGRPIGDRDQVGAGAAGEDREVELWEPVRRELGELYLAIGRPDLGSLMFPGVRGAVVSRRNWARDSWLPALAGARLVEGYEDLPHFGAHKLRATCASMLGYALTPKHVMLDFLGHEQETTTIKHYLRAFRDAKARAREGIAVEEQILQARSLFEPDAADHLANAG